MDAKNNVMDTKNNIVNVKKPETTTLWIGQLVRHVILGDGEIIDIKQNHVHIKFAGYKSNASTADDEGNPCYLKETLEDENYFIEIEEAIPVDEEIEAAPIDPENGYPVCKYSGRGCSCADEDGACNISNCPYEEEYLLNLKEGQ